MSDHVRGAAEGQYAIGEHRLVTDGGVLVYEYDVRCEDCGVALAVVRHSVPKIDHDPARCGLICGACAGARAVEDAEAQSGEPAPGGEG